MFVQETDLTLIHYSVILPLVKKTFEKDQSNLEQYVHIKDPYMTVVHEALTSLCHDLQQLRRAQQKRNIRVYLVDNDVTFSTYGYVCNRYEGQNRYMNANLKRQTGRCMTRYLRGERLLPAEITDR
ncbi:hypothetical protein HNR44_000372 [Geomicrobium halophilum]|uniref:Uncharacterized protein n=1 Tax=Geomicrobium halophilum TaxID=549000 RepID=A0A841PVZ6_9BACL|nr:hypothetical protein [Geomicrobium halophilum]MBB6448423.1 hypothetical protein [Geomicrobium halophilum]